jgi:hypothetical protein
VLLDPGTVTLVYAVSIDDRRLQRRTSGDPADGGAGTWGARCSNGSRGISRHSRISDLLSTSDESIAAPDSHAPPSKRAYNCGRRFAEFDAESLATNCFKNILYVIERNAREKTRTSTVNSTAIKVLSRWHSLSYPQRYPAVRRTSAATCWYALLASPRSIRQ